MYQCPTIDALSGLGSNPGNAVGSRRYPSSTLSPNRVMGANVSSPPPKMRNPTPLSDAGSPADARVGGGIVVGEGARPDDDRGGILVAGASALAGPTRPIVTCT